MLKSFDDMDNGTVFFNSFTHTACMKISTTRYYDVTLKHCIKMRSDLREHKHLTAKLFYITEESDE